MNATLLNSEINSKDLKVLSKNIKDIEESDDKEFFKNLIESFLGQAVDEDSEDMLLEKFLNFSQNSEDGEKLLQFLSKIDTKLAIKSDSSDEKAAEILVEDLLKLSFAVKNDIDVNDFQTSSKELKVALEDKNFIQDIKSAKNISELLNVAKKYDLKVTKFEFSKEQIVVDPKESKLTKEFKSEDVIRMIEKKLENSTHKLIESIKNDTTHKENTLKNILSKVETTSHHDSKKVETKEVFIPKVETAQKKQEAKVIKTEQIIQDSKMTQQTKEIKTTQTTQEEKVVQQTKDIKTEQTIQDSKMTQQTKEIKITQTTQEEKVVQQTKDIKTEPKVEKAPLEIREQKIDTKEKLAETPKVKLEDNSLKITEQVVKKETTTKIVQSTPQTKQAIEKETGQDIAVEKDSTTFEEVTKIEHTTNTQKTQTVKPKVEVKHTLNTFAQDFKEQVESYKPPLMKVKMQLNPKGLGEVDVTMINRGNNLHITVNSNPNTIAIFSQNQTEFKNSLVSMGFSELNMSFNENGQNKDGSQNKKKNSQNQSHHDEQQLTEDSFEIVTPIYV